jgi:hypothetical protein
MILLYEDKDEPMISLLPQKAAFSIIVVIWHHCIVSLCVREREMVCVWVGGCSREKEKKRKRERERVRLKETEEDKEEGSSSRR